MPLDQPLPGGLQPDRVELGELELPVAVAGHPAVGEDVAAAEEVGGLHVGDGERLEPRTAIGDDAHLPGRGTQHVEDCFLIRTQLLPVEVSQHALGRPETKLTAFRPQAHPQPFEHRDQLCGIHLSSSQVGRARVLTESTPPS